MRYINRINLLVIKMNYDFKERTNTFVQYHDSYYNQIISKIQLWRFVHFEIWFAFGNLSARLNHKKHKSICSFIVKLR